MGLDNFYSLRKDFVLIGLTGKMQSGADEFIELLTKKNLSPVDKKYLRNFQDVYKEISSSESAKIRKINDFFAYKENWVQFEVLDYRNVLLLFILKQNFNTDPNVFAKNIVDWICNLGSYKSFETPRFGGNVSIAKNSDKYLRKEFLKILQKKVSDLNFTVDIKNKNLDDFVKSFDNDFFFQNPFKEFAQSFFNELDKYSPYLRYKLLHVTAYCLRRFGSLDIKTIKKDNNAPGLKHVYCIAKVINQLIKKHRKPEGENSKTARIIIDRLKNSYELMFFKEKYSGFHMVALNFNEEQRIKRIEKKYQNKDLLTDKLRNTELIKSLDSLEYKTSDFKKGIFDSFDVENCVQKADYHLFGNTFLLEENLSEYEKASEQLSEQKIEKTNKFYVYQPFKFQVLKLVALIQQPGIVTPTYIERVMQIAHTTKLNSGCISRQVGAVVTDKSFSVKGIGWNDVPHGQAPCANRDLRDLVVDKNNGFTEFELGRTKHRYKDGKSFNQKIRADYTSKEKSLEENLKGRPCPFCFKKFHNDYENKENQVHTRSLHAEENAMLQITKHGGQGLEGGNLFTTASPCELCSKKAFQLGIKNIFYIDLYPGISKNHILEGGINKSNNPNLYQYQGVIGRGFQKFYEPFMSIKDETMLRSKIKPTKTDNSEDLIKELTEDENKQKKIKEILNK